MINVYDPKVSAQTIQSDLNYLAKSSEHSKIKNLRIESDPYKAAKGSHAIAILTEWDEFKSLDWNMIYKVMKKPAFIFDGRNILNKKDIQSIGFIYKQIG